jgi:hypothetical protein
MRQAVPARKSAAGPVAATQPSKAESGALRIGEPNDAFEQEAERVADEIMAGGSRKLGRSLARVPIGAPLQRKCACGGSGGAEGECEECKQKKEATLRRRSTGHAGPDGAPPIVHEVLRSPGEPLDAATRAFFEPRFGHHFGRVRVHADAKAEESARAVNALAYTVGDDIVLGTEGRNLATLEGRKLLAHELAHVVQQEGSWDHEWSPGVEALPGAGHRVRVLPPVGKRGDAFEQVADRAAEGLSRSATIEGAEIPRLHSHAFQLLELPSPVPICGALVTDIDVLPARPRPLVECGLPPTVMVTRINIVGRARTPASTGRGRIVFNLHVGYYRDPATGRLCAVISDSERCLTPGGCLHLGCLPTLEEVLDAIWGFLKDLLAAIGIILLAILAALILRGLRVPVEEGPMPGVPGGVPVIAGETTGQRPGSMEA